MKTIYLIDYIGVHCGMHYYNEAFKRVLSDIPDVEVRILSNYTDSDNLHHFFKNQYIGNRISKGISLLINLNRLKRFVKTNPEDIYIYLSYGNWIDELFMRIITKAPNHIIDIHEAIAQNVDANENLKSKFKSLYRDKIRTVISHSSRTDDFLNEYGYKGHHLRVPHFKYIFPKNFDEHKISDDIKDSIDSGKINILFFGNLSISKGVDILMEAVNLVDDTLTDKLNIIIAGKDFDGAVNKVVPKVGRNIHIFPRHISDDELRYLYSKADYLALPYRKTSQSGILEMAFYFKKPIIASDVTYFRKTLEEFPSFGVLSGNSAEDYARTLESVVTGHGSHEFFTDSDYARYENRREVADFRAALAAWLASRQS